MSEATDTLDALVAALDEGRLDKVHEEVGVLRGLLNGLCAETIDHRVCRDAEPCLRPLGHTEWHDDGRQAWLRGTDGTWNICPTGLVKSANA